jgi:flavodoxin
MAKKKTKNIAAEVKAALEEAGYQFPELKSKRAHLDFVEEHHYDPIVVLNSTVKMAEVFPKDWKKRISPIESDEEAE